MEEIEISNEVSVWFRIYREVDYSNKNLPDDVEKMDRDERRNTTTAIFIQVGMNGGARSSPLEQNDIPEALEKDGYYEPPPPSGNVSPPGSYNPPWPKFNGDQIPRPISWDGTELCLAPKWKGQPWSALPAASVRAYIDKNDNTKYHNKASWEMERRTAEDVDEPVENG